VYAFCHGLGFHNALLLPWLKNQFSSDQYEIVFLILALRTLSQMVSETQSGRIANEKGCLHVLRLCTWLRFVAIICLIIAAIISNKCMALALVATWAVFEGVGSAMYSGADVQLICRHTQQHHIKRDLSRQRVAWLLSRSISSFVAWTLITNIYIQMIASLASIACASFTLYGTTTSTATWMPSKHGAIHDSGTQDISVNIKHWLKQFVLIPLPLKCMFLYAITTQVQMETFFKLLPFTMPHHQHALPLLTSIGFLCNALGSWIAGRVKHRYTYCQCIFGVNLLYWWWIQPTSDGRWVIIIVGTYTILPIVWGFHQTALQNQMLEQITLNNYHVVTYLSSYKLVTQWTQIMWMCLFISPLLDIGQWHISHVYGLLACITSLNLFIHRKMHV